MRVFDLIGSPGRAVGVGYAIMHAIALVLLVVTIWPILYYYGVSHWLPMVLLGYVWAALCLQFVLLVLPRPPRDIL